VYKRAEMLVQAGWAAMCQHRILGVPFRIKHKVLQCGEGLVSTSSSFEQLQSWV
jgi:hypothetical protein